MASQPTNPRTNNPVRPYHLPPPTLLPLRHCSHNEDDTPIDEVECLLSLLCPSTDAMRNKEHYILATAEPVPLDASAQRSDSTNPKKRKRAEALQEELNQRASALRSGARSIPGVPIIYVKRSVMILEPMSTPSEKVRLGVERSKFKTGVEAALSAVGGKRKRDDEDEAAAKPRGLKRAKAPNPLSVKKPKKDKPRPEGQGRKPSNGDENANGNGSDGETTNAAKTKRKRRHKSSKAAGEDSHNAETAGTELHAARDDTAE
jgi:U3 small nucleolar RNA-associated protein 23